MQDSYLTRVAEEYKPDFAFAYGSGIFRQDGNIPQQADFIFGVNDPIAWHRKNMQRHPKDYSWSGRLAFSVCPGFQDTGAGIWYHPFVRFEDQIIKYGVISIDRIVDDLKNWTTLYVAGRMQKPVKVVVEDETVTEANQQNLEQAMVCSLHMLPKTVDQKDLWLALAGISYTGDSRMKIGEDIDKVRKIVKSTGHLMPGYYAEAAASIGVDLSQDQIRNPIYQKQSYPPGLPKSFEISPALLEWTSLEKRKELLKQNISRIIRRSSTSQTLKGMVTAGTIRSMRYLSHKMQKSRKSKKETPQLF